MIVNRNSRKNCWTRGIISAYSVCAIDCEWEFDLSCQFNAINPAFRLEKLSSSCSFSSYTPAGLCGVVASPGRSPFHNLLLHWLTCMPGIGCFSRGLLRSVLATLLSSFLLTAGTMLCGPTGQAQSVSYTGAQSTVASLSTVSTEPRIQLSQER